MSLNLPTTVYEILKSNPDQKMTARMIAEEVHRIKPDECKKKKEKSKFKDDKELITQIIAEIASTKELILKKDKSILTIEERPRKFIYKTIDNDNEVEIEVDEEDIVEKNILEAEKDLYPKLCSFLWLNKKIYPKRIDEKKSTNSKGKKGNIWLHPDVVGFEFYIDGFDQNIIDLINEIKAEEKIALYSYEVKLSLNKSNIRESYFQAASNSSWANYGYLVSSNIKEDVIPECKILSNQFGIGLILLDKDEPTENSEILINARRNNLNWASINRIFEQNSDFQEFIKTIRDSLKVNKVIMQGWDLPIFKDV